MRSSRINAKFSERDSRGSPIDTLCMSGEGFQVACPAELDGKHAYDLDRWAEVWLKRNRRAIREDVGAFRRDSGTMLCIMSVDWKRDNLARHGTSPR